MAKADRIPFLLQKQKEASIFGCLLYLNFFIGSLFFLLSDDSELVKMGTLFG